MPSIWLVVFMMRTWTVVVEWGILRSGGGWAILGFVLGRFLAEGKRDARMGNISGDVCMH